MLSRAGVQFVDLVVGRECCGGYGEEDRDRGLPPYPFGWSTTRAVARLVVLAVTRLVVARAVARMLCVLLMLVLDVRLMMHDGSWRLVRRFGTGLSA